MSQRYNIGIDLGTTNIAVAYQLMNANNDIQLLRIPQLIAPGSVVSLSSLPAVRYLEPNVKQSSELYRLPWGCDEVIIGELAKEVSLNSGTQAVHSAKSWLAHQMLDITQACLPIGAMDAAQKVSVIQVISEYLTYIEHAWNTQFPHVMFKEQSIVVTIPASFDERARQYIVQAIEQCGLEEVKLLEEPQAAFYHWLGCHKEMAGIRCDEPQTSLALVCDVGGGTTDFSLISLSIDQSGPHFERIAVGKHLLLGGDNMDLAIYHYLKQKYPDEVSAENRAQWIMQARLAKEKLLANKTQDVANLIVLQKGKSLFKNQKKVQLKQSEIEQIILNGFMPQVEIGDTPNKPRHGIRRIGLPYEHEVAITKHLGAFLRDVSKVVHQRFPNQYPSSVVIPDVVLFNGGVFYSERLQEAVLQNIRRWKEKCGQDPEVDCLVTDSPSLAVAKGAVYFQMAKEKPGMQIKSDVPASYFIELDGGNNRLLCLLPQGSKMNEKVEIPQKFKLKVGEMVSFPFLYARNYPEVYSGVICEKSKEMVRLPPLLLAIDQDNVQKQEIEVRLSAIYTDIGVIEVEASADNGQCYRLHLNTNQDISVNANSEFLKKKVSVTNVDKLGESTIQTVIKLLADYFVRKRVALYEVKNQLQTLVGNGDKWHLSVARELFDILWDFKGKRIKNAEAERTWLSLLGLSIRPGLGDIGDVERIKKMHQLYEEGVQFRGVAQNHAEWWILWRRASLGLSANQQQVLFHAIKAVIFTRKDQLNKVTRFALVEKMRLLASLEKIRMTDRVKLGDMICAKLMKSPQDILLWWMISRVGTRESFADVIDMIPIDVVEGWLTKLLTLTTNKQIQITVVKTWCLMARKVEAEEQNIDKILYKKMEQRLNRHPKELAILQGKMVLSEELMQFAMGDALPLGLSLS